MCEDIKKRGRPRINRTPEEQAAFKKAKNKRDQERKMADPAQRARSRKWGIERTMHIDAEMYKNLDPIASRLGLSVRDLAAKIINDYIAKNS